MGPGMPMYSGVAKPPVKPPVLKDKVAMPAARAASPPRPAPPPPRAGGGRRMLRRRARQQGKGGAAMSARENAVNQMMGE